MDIEKARSAVTSWREAGYKDEDIAKLVAEKSPEVSKLLQNGIPAAEALDNVLGLGAIEEKSEETVIKEEVAKSYDTEGTTIPRIVAGIGADVAISEGAKAAGTAIGAKTALALGQAGPQAAAPEEAVTVPLGSAIGYVTGALTGGIAGDITAQRIENPNKPISWARAGTAAFLNLLPGTELKRGPAALRRASQQLAKRPVRAQMVMGAAVGPAAVAAEEFLQTGELPSGQQLALSSGTSAVLGGSLGMTGKAVNKMLKNVFRKSPVQLERAIQSGDKDAIDYINGITRMMSEEERKNLATPKEVLSYITNAAKADLAPSTVVGTKATKIMRDASNAVMAGEDTGGLLGKNVQELISLAESPEAAQEFAMRYMAGEVSKVPDEFAKLGEQLSTARGMIREYQEKLLLNHESGQRQLPDVLAEQIRESMNRGDYLTRSYRFFDDGGYKPSKQQYDAALDSLVADGMEKKDAVAYLAELNAKKSDAESAFSMMRSQSSGPLKKRKDLSPELRNYLGEYTLPGEKIAKTMSVISRLEAYDTADRKVSSELQRMGIASTGDGIGPDWVPLNLRRGVAHVGEDKLFVPPHVQRAIDQLYGGQADTQAASKALQFLEDAWDTSISLSKATKVVMNPPSYAVQLYGNTFNLAGMGMNPAKGLGKGLQASFAQFGGSGVRTPEQIQRFKMYRERGLVPPGVTYQDIQSGLGGSVGAQVQKLVDPLGKAYSVPDIAMRVVAFENHASMLRRFANGAGDENKILDIAQELTNNTYQNYDYLNKTLRGLSRKGVMPQFASFTMELMRNQYHQGNTIRKMLSGQFADELEAELGVTVNRKQIAIEGGKRLAMLTAVYGATGAGIDAVTSSNMTDEQAQARRETVLPEWDKHQSTVMRLNDKGELQSMNASYIVPHMTLYGMVQAGLRGDSFVDGMKNGVESLKEQFVGEGSFVFNAAANALGTYDRETGDVISTSQDAWGQFSDRVTKYLEEAYSPGVAREIKKAEGQDTGVTVARQLGIRINTTTDEKGFSFRTRKFRDTSQQIAKRLSSARYADMDRLGRRKTKEELGMEYQVINEDYKANQRELIKHVENMRILGYDDDKIATMMMKQFVRSEDVLNALDGHVADMPVVDKMSVREIYERILEKPGKDPLEYIMEVAKTDRELGKALIRYDKEYRVKKIREVTTRDEMLGNLDSDTKTNFVVRYMQRSKDPESTLMRYAQKGIIDKQEYHAAKLKYEAAKGK